jgi:two-component system, response regulator YesN
MYHVLLVEDDRLEQELLQQSWVWQNGDFALAATAASGLEAWEIVRQGNIDIVVTDIKMPLMDGLELSKLIHDEMPNVKIILLSGHSDFQYARQAISLGVSEYLLKTVKSDDLLEALRKVAAKLQEEARIYQEVSDYRAQLQNNRQHQRQALLENLSLGIKPVENQEQLEDLLGFSPDCQSACCAIVSYLDDKTLINQPEHLMILDSQQAVAALIDNKEIISFAHSLRETCLIFCSPRLPEAKAILRSIQTDIVRQQRKFNWPAQPEIALGGIKQGLGGIAESFSEARFLLNFQHLFGDNTLLFIDEVQPMNQSSYRAEQTLAKDKEAIARVMDQGSTSEVQGIVDSLVGRLQSLNMSLVFIQYTFIDIGNIIRQYLLQIGENPDTALSEQSDLPNRLLSGNVQNWAKDLPAFGQYLAQTLASVIDLRNRQRRFQYADVILKGKKYIDQHFDDPELNLTSLAAVVNLNPSYFSNLFSHEMGCTFIEYLTGLRIDKAKSLLRSTSLSTLEIAFAVGYSDSNYFSKIFKKITSESPRSYRRIG